MHLLLCATAAACALLFAYASPTTVADQPPRTLLDPASLYQQPPLDGMSMVFALPQS